MFGFPCRKVSPRVRDFSAEKSLESSASRLWGPSKRLSCRGTYFSFFNRSMSSINLRRSV